MMPQDFYIVTDPNEDICYKHVTCAKCFITSECTPHNDFYFTPLWDGEGRVCEGCFNSLVYDHLNRKK